MSRLRMYNEYLAPYKAAVDAGVGSIMSSFNILTVFQPQPTNGY